MRLDTFKEIDSMYAIVKTGGKQYKVAPGDKINVEKIPAEVGETIALDAICIVDGTKVEADPAVAAKTKVEAKVLNQFKDKKQLVFKFKKRKGYKKLQGHRQPLTRIQIVTVGSEKFKEAKKAAPKAEKKTAEKDVEKTEKAGKAPAKASSKATAKTTAKPAEKKTATKAEKAPAKSTAKTAKADEKPKAAKKTTTKKADEKPTEE